MDDLDNMMFATFGKVLQDEVGEWATRNFGAVESWQPLMGVGEELGELNHAHLKRAQAIRGMTQDEYMAQARDAVGDIFIFLAHYCHLEGIDMMMSVLETWERVSQRNWVDSPDTGEQ